MRILHIITGLNNGGAEAVLYRLTSDVRHQHQVISLMHPGTYGPLLEARGITVYSLGLSRGQISLGALMRLWRLIRRIRPDLIQTWMYHSDLLGSIVGYLAGVQSIVWGIRNSRLDAKSSSATRAVVKLLAKLSGISPRLIVSCSEDALQVHTALGYRREKIVVIPNGYDVSQLAPDPAARARVRAEIGISDDTFVIGMVGRWDLQKDHETLCLALERLSASPGRWRCVLVGPSMTAMNAQLAALLYRTHVGDRVVLLGPRNDIPAIMNALDVHVLSSAYGEAFPNVVAEAMACGTPCVITDVGDARLIIADTGWVAPIRDHAKLAEGLEEAMTAARSPADWSRRREACRERIVREFPLQLMMDRFHDVWTRTATSRASAPRDQFDAVITDFGHEWTRFNQTVLSKEERETIFSMYFSIFPWDLLPKAAIGFDVGCGSGRWAALVAPRVGHLFCVDPSNAIEVASRALRLELNCTFLRAAIEELPFQNDSMDFGYSIGVLHHVRDPREALRAAVGKLKSGAPFLVYVYYALENRPGWFRFLWLLTDRTRRLVSHWPSASKHVFADVVAFLVYLPLARMARMVERLGLQSKHLPLNAYSKRSFYVMRTDALDRFGTKVEKRFTQTEIRAIMQYAGLERIVFSSKQPYWCAVGFKA